MDFLESALLEAALSANDGVECEKPGEGDCPWPSYSMTDADGEIYICTVRREPPRVKTAGLFAFSMHSYV